VNLKFLRSNPSEILQRNPSEESLMSQSLKSLLILIHESLGEDYRSAKST
jgi:hypothetical protein